MTRNDIIKLHLANTTSQSYQDHFEEMVEIFELCLRCLDDHDFPDLRGRIRTILEA